MRPATHQQLLRATCDVNDVFSCMQLLLQQRLLLLLLMLMLQQQPATPQSLGSLKQGFLGYVPEQPIHRMHAQKLLLLLSLLMLLLLLLRLLLRLLLPTLGLAAADGKPPRMRGLLHDVLLLPLFLLA